MAHEGLLSLKWNNHKTTFFNVLSTIRSKESYCDATIACDGRFYPVHKLIVSTCSDYLMEMFERTKCKHPFIVVTGIRHEDLEALLNYMYLGEVNVRHDELDGLVKAAESLMIKGLAIPDETPNESPSIIKRGANEETNPQAKRRRCQKKDGRSINDNNDSDYGKISSLKDQIHRDSSFSSLQQDHSDLDPSVAQDQLFLRPDSFSDPSTDITPNDPGPSQSQGHQFHYDPVKGSRQDMQYAAPKISEPNVVIKEDFEGKSESENIQDIDGALHDSVYNSMFGHDLGLHDDLPGNNTLPPSTKEPMTRKQRFQLYKAKYDRIIEYMRNGLANLPQLTKPERRNLYRSSKTHIWDETSQEIYYIGRGSKKKQGHRMRVITSDDEAVRIMSQCHLNQSGAGHVGISYTLKNVSEFSYWAGMKEDIVEYIRNCEECQRSEYPRNNYAPVGEALELIDN